MKNIHEREIICTLVFLSPTLRVMKPMVEFAKSVSKTCSPLTCKGLAVPIDLTVHWEWNLAALMHKLYVLERQDVVDLSSRYQDAFTVLLRR